MKGKELCEILKSIRKKIADANGIAYQPHECTHQGDCLGTCPMCDDELHRLTEEIRRIEETGVSVNMDVLSEEEKQFIISLSEHGSIETSDIVTVSEMGIVEETGDIAPEDEILMGEPRLFPEEEEILMGIPAMPEEFLLRGEIDHAVYGAIIGDIVGSRFEFNPTNDYNFDLFTPECSFTDDTICTIAIADALLKKRDFGESIHDWCRRYPSPTGGYGISFHKWVLSDNPKPYNSFGNGAAMRVSPVACWFENIDKVLQAAAETAQPTHNHPEGVKGAQTVALAIAKAIYYNKKRTTRAADNVEYILAECIKFSDYNIGIRLKDVQNRFDETCQGTVPVALWIIKNSDGFEDAIRRAVSLGADADTLGAIVGSIAGAIWGVPDIYKDCIEMYLTPEMTEVLLAFHQTCINRK